MGYGGLVVSFSIGIRKEAFWHIPKPLGLVAGIGEGTGCWFVVIYLPPVGLGASQCNLWLKEEGQATDGCSWLLPEALVGVPESTGG